MKPRQLVAVMVACLLRLPVPVWAETFVDPGAGNWVTIADISPFAFNGIAPFGQGVGSDYDYFGPHPASLGASAGYNDPSREMFVHAVVRFNARTDYLDHLLESNVWDTDTGRVADEGSMPTVQGQPIFLFCDPPTNCTDRDYWWRSGANVVVEIEASCTHRPPYPEPSVALPCPEPTEILAAYLQRYPSNLMVNWAVPDWNWFTSDAHVQQFLQTETALHLASALYHLADLERRPVSTLQQSDVTHAGGLLVDFAQLREQHFHGPPAAKEQARMDALRAPLNGKVQPLDVQLRALRAIATEYQQWWSARGFTPPIMPALLPLDATPTPVAPTPTSTPLTS